MSDDSEDEFAVQLDTDYSQSDFSDEESSESEEEEEEAGRMAIKRRASVECAQEQQRHCSEVVRAQKGVEMYDPKKDMLSEEDQERRRENIRAMLSGNLSGVRRHPLLPDVLTVQEDTALLKRPFKSPYPNAPAMSESLKRALLARRQFVPFGSGKKFVPVKVTIPDTYAEEPVDTKEEDVPLPEGIEELVLWTSSDGMSQVKVDNCLARFLRPHQREGVRFMFECVMGLRDYDGQGSILADDMGLGKTLQSIALLWTLLNASHPELGEPVAKRIVICCPTSLVSNWDNECVKWLNGKVRTMPICDSSREEVIDSLTEFLSPRNPVQVLIISYETFRIHAERFTSSGTCDLLICDEAHRLKNDQTLTNRALGAMECKRRILLSGTPLQNRLQEFYAMVNFCNPGVLGSLSEFRKMYERPILAGREPDASDDEKQLAKERSDALSSFVNAFILRRTNDLLSAHLPPKVIQLVCCKMTPIQVDLYTNFVQSRSVVSLMTKKIGKALSAITTVRKLMNHPKLIYDMVKAAKSKSSDRTGFEECQDSLQPELYESSGYRSELPQGWEEYSGKFAVVARMLNLLRTQTKDRVVIVSNFTQTLDLFSILCREKKYPCLRLDGSISLKKRKAMVDKFNDQKDDQFVFLLSSKAGGCGLNLIGGNRLVLFDMSWNPAEDKQSAARVWREGQLRNVFIYKFVTTGTIEEKIFQRQINKEGLQSVVATTGTKREKVFQRQIDKEGMQSVDDRMSDANGQADTNAMSFEELRDLFTYNPDTLSTTYEHIVLEKDEELLSQDAWKRTAPVEKKQQGNPKEDDLANWGLHSDVSMVPDQCLRLCGGNDVSFVFSCQVDGRPVPPESPLLPSTKRTVLGPKSTNVETTKQTIICDSEEDD